MLALEGVTKRFGAHTVLDGVDAAFRPDAVHFLMGPNGAGKTTLIRCILGLYDYQGRAIWRDQPVDPSDRRICPVFDDPPWHTQLTGLQNLRVLLPEARRLDRAYLSDHVLHSRVKSYSHGQRMRLALTGAMNSGAELIILDEPTNGLDREAMRQLRHDLAEMSATTTFLVTGHNLEFYDDVIDSLHVLSNGTLVEHDIEALAPKGGARLAKIYDENCPTDHQ